VVAEASPEIVTLWLSTFLVSETVLPYPVVKPYSTTDDPVTEVVHVMTAEGPETPYAISDIVIAGVTNVLSLL